MSYGCGRSFMVSNLTLLLRWPVSTYGVHLYKNILHDYTIKMLVYVMLVDYSIITIFTSH